MFLEQQAASTASDVVFIDTLSLEANIGADCWGKTRAQPIQLSVYLHLRPRFLNISGATDDVADSVHYGHLTKVISKLVKGKATVGDGEGSGFDGIDALVHEVALEAFQLAGEAADQVRVVVEAPKLILLASNFVVDTIVSRNPGVEESGSNPDPDASSSQTNGTAFSNPRSGSTRKSRKVTISDLSIPVIIGVNHPERLAKQRVVIDIVFYEGEGQPVISHTEYQSTMNSLIEDIERSEYLTLEKFVMQIVQKAVLSSTSLEAVTVRAQKPSALSFAKYSGVEITRRRGDFA